MTILTQKFDYAQYLADAEASKVSPLERRLLPGFSDVGIEIEVFALPGFDTDPERYLLSMRSTALAVKRNPRSLFSFLDSMKGKALIQERCGGSVFKKENFQSTAFNDSFVGIPGEIATAYWYSQAMNANKLAEDILWVLIKNKLADLASDAFEVIRTPQQRAENFKNSWEIVRGNTRNGYKTIKGILTGYFREEFFTKFPHGQVRQNSNQYVKSCTDALLTDICCEIVRSLSGQRPTDIYNELKLAGEDPNREELRDWYSQELLEAIEGVQDKLIKMFQQNPKIIADFDAESVIPGLASEYGMIDWHPSV